MKAIKVSLLFFFGCFLVQLSLFFIAPTFYLSSVDKSKVPIFIKLAFTKYFLIILALYLLWGFLVGNLNRGLLKLNSDEAQKTGGGIFFHLSLCLAEFLLMFLLVAVFYPSVFSFIPKLSFWPLKQSYTVLISLILFAIFLALFLNRPFHLKKIFSTLVVAMIPAALQLLFIWPAALNLPMASAITSKEKPHILLLGFDALDGESGDEAIEEVSAGLKARVYSNAFTPLPSTNPSWNSILTGLYPKNHHVRFIFESPLTPMEAGQFLPHELQQVGYGTLFASDQPETSYFDERQGFDQVAFPTVGWEAHLRAILLNHFIFPAIWLNNRWTEKILKTTMNSPSLFNYELSRFFNYSFRRLGELPPGSKMMALHNCFLHSPIRLSSKELQSTPHYLELSPKQFSFWDWPKVGDTPAHTPEGWINPYYIRREEAQGFIRELVKELKDKSYLDSSIVVLLSDHGERFAAGHEVYGGIHGMDLETRAQSNVMLTIFDPQLSGFEKNHDPVSLIDLTPTLMARLGIAAQQGVHYDGLALMDKQSQAQVLPDRPLWIENMGFIQANQPSSFPQILVKNLEESLHYKHNGGVVVGEDYYQEIIKNKTTKDVSKILTTLH